MTNKQAISIVHGFNCNLKWTLGSKEHELNKALGTILSLASRMAMYEWWWGLTTEEANKHGIGFLEYCDFPLRPTQEDCVMKEWEEADNG